LSNALVPNLLVTSDLSTLDNSAAVREYSVMVV